MHKPIILKDLTLELPHKICFANFCAAIPCASKIAVIGNNGSGKTTLLKTINKMETLVEGSIIIPDGVVISYVPQIVEDYAALSGGERFNKALSAALAANPDVLLLDEPTNHLDVRNRKSLMNMLGRYDNTLIIVSHDSELLRQINTIWHIDNGQINIFSGNYDDYKREQYLKIAGLENKLTGFAKEKKLTHKKLMQAQQIAAKSRRSGEKKKAEGKWAPIVAGGKERAAQVSAGKKFKDIGENKDGINEQLRNLRMPEVIKPSFNLSYAPFPYSPLFISDGAVGYLPNIPILTKINISIEPNSKIAITGANASGKTTLLRAILGDPSVYKTGIWDIPKKEDIGYLDQHYNNLDYSKTVIGAISSLTPYWTRGEIRKHLNDFLFRKNEEVDADISSLSGGERARLSLAAIACKIPKLLLLDEITNNIDLQTREHIEQILRDYPGAMVVVSHDMDFLNNIGIENRYLIDGTKERKI
ncbi:MAG: ATP-binding cassette domain-containing protein [Elusimicrobiota bacterium]|jgi:ATPase subunit of ABC transporter with duplicated ATPase domains|nr:ATP-binding cassette domain-containing protein [Elusimicrobiota bacterium]